MTTWDFLDRTAICAALLLAAAIPLPAVDEAIESPETPTEPTAPSALRLFGATADERAAALVRYVASCRPAHELSPKAAAPAYAARLILDTDTAYALAKLDAAIAAQFTQATQGSFDPFAKVALINTWLLAKDRIPPAMAMRLRDYIALWSHRVWKGYGAMNYRLMMDGAGYLAAEAWPDLVDHDGLDAAGIRKATGDRLDGYLTSICWKNFHEVGSPIYLAVDLSAIRMLAEFARDAAMRTKATLTLDAMLLDIACTWNQGYNVGTAGRAKYWASTNTSPDSMGASAAAAWLAFGAKRPIAAADTGWIHSFWMATPGTYRVPAEIIAVATDRTVPFTTRSTVPGMAGDVHRQTYHAPSYSLCSQWDRGASPGDGLYKEARRNMLKWVSDTSSSTFAVCMENPQRPYALQNDKANALGYGENAFAQYHQHDGTLLGLYAVPETVTLGKKTFPYPYYRLYAPFPTGGSIVLRREQDGWVACHGGGMLFAFRSVKPYVWDKKPWAGNDLLWVEARTNGWVLETSELAPFAGGGVAAELNRFLAALIAKTAIDASGLAAPIPRLRYTTLGGRQLDVTWLPHGAPYAGQAKVDGRALDYPGWKQIDNPWVRQEAGQPQITITRGDRQWVYDFAAWTRTEQATPAR